MPVKVSNNASIFMKIFMCVVWLLAEVVSTFAAFQIQIAGSFYGQLEKSQIFDPFFLYIGGNDKIKLYLWLKCYREAPQFERCCETLSSRERCCEKLAIL